MKGCEGVQRGTEGNSGGGLGANMGRGIGLENLCS